MRLNEFVYDEDIVEDEAEARGDMDLITTLEFLRNQSAGKHLVPRVRVDSLINMINMHNGNETFSNPSLMNAFKSNEVVKNLIADIKDDESTGIKYVYLQPTESDDPDQIDGSADGATAVKTEPEKVVSNMANKAIANRS
jgi:hypothetical protein